VTKEVTAEGLVTASGEIIPAQTVIISIGDVPALPFLPETIETVSVGGAAWITTDKAHVTSNVRVLAVGDVEKPGLATNALGAGKTAAEYIIAQIKGEEWRPFTKQVIPQQALTITHYFPGDSLPTETRQPIAACPAPRAGTAICARPSARPGPSAGGRSPPPSASTRRRAKKATSTSRTTANASPAASVPTPAPAASGP